ncbi:MAG: type I restriction-modification system subunit M, partial [Mucispirillum sp.]|nr:type I restriction-modification system subunit M [Mucispirillum sp.]
TDLLGKAYMYLLKQFASGAGKKAGEFFTPENLSKLIAKLAMPKPGDRICDPACGSGSLLLMVGDEVGGNNFSLYGQEKIGSTYNLARMNMYIHHQEQATIEWGDTLNNPLLKDENGLRKFEVVVANPPFSLDKWGSDSLASDEYNRFHRGMPPRSVGDYAFISHMVEVAKDRVGRVVVIVPHGVLFRGRSEAVIRKALIEENLLDAVIGLPAGLFQTTGIPVAVLVFDKSRQIGGANENRRDIVFIDASREYTAGKAQNEINDEHINKIVSAYKERKEVEKYSHIADIDEVRDNDYNLNIPRYVDTFEEEEQVDMKQVAENIEKLERELETVKIEMKKCLLELDI